MTAPLPRRIATTADALASACSLRIPTPRQKETVMSAPEPSPAEQARIDRIEAAPEPPEIAVERERLERVTEALLITVLGTDDRDFLIGCDLPADEIARLIVEYGAAAAIAAMPAHPAEAAVKRVEVACDDLADRADRVETKFRRSGSPAGQARWNQGSGIREALRGIRAALGDPS